MKRIYNLCQDPVPKPTLTKFQKQRIKEDKRSFNNGKFDFKYAEHLIEQVSSCNHNFQFTTFKKQKLYITFYQTNLGKTKTKIIVLIT